MGSTQIMIQNAAYLKLKFFKEENNLKSFTEAIYELLGHYTRFSPTIIHTKSDKDPSIAEFAINSTRCKQVLVTAK